MRRLICIFLFFFGVHFLNAQQPLNNEWIDYSKVYYKFKVGKTGLYRISQTALATVNLQNTNVEQFQLWRNGKQVPIYTTIPSGVLGSSDYIEFWGYQNDGESDKYLYRDTLYQINNSYSLQTDTAAYFLTVNLPTPSNPNLRFTDASNTIPTTPPPPDAYFMYKHKINFKDMLNRGFAQNAGEYVYSSAYDKGEFWSTNEINTSTPYSVITNPFYPANVGINATLKAGFAGNAQLSRDIELSLNGSASNIVSGTLNSLDVAEFTNPNIPYAALTAANNTFSIKIITTNTFDRVVCNYVELTYPRQFNFGGQSSFEFNLSPSSTGNFLNITNFNSGASAPVLYDLTNNLRYVANTTIPGVLRFALPANNSERSLVLVSSDVVVNGLVNVAGFEKRQFVNYALPALQGDYLIVSNKILGFSGTGAVEKYRAYRNTEHNAKIYDIDELVDQFAFGIKKHPLSVKNFIRFANANFSKKPNYLFMIGKGVTYDEYRKFESNPNAELLNLVPTWGWPASDVMLASNGVDPEPTVGVGRLSAITEDEVLIYLDKVKEYEDSLAFQQTISSKSWMKQVVHVAGADDTSLDQIIDGYFRNYKNIITNPLYGGIVSNFNKTTTGPVTATANTQLNNLFATGISLITYFGHGSSTLLDYANLNDPTVFNNGPGKYPMFLVNGCSVGSFYDYDIARFGTIASIAEKYIFAKKKGSIGFIGNSHFGLTNVLDNYSTGFYNSLASTGYFRSVSTNMNDAIFALKSGSSSGFNDFYTRTHAEETVLEGDPAVKIHGSAKPDYAVEEAKVVTSPAIISVSDVDFTIKAYIYNLGKAITDSVHVLITRKYPDGTMVQLYNQKLPGIKYMDSVTLTIPIIPSKDKGSNQITVTVDDDFKFDEISESNNGVTKTFVILDNGIIPVYPSKYAIVNKSQIQLVASTANPVSPLNNYVMEMDTTALFNSSFKISKTVSSVGGAISFDPGITLVDSTVYYWRVAQVPNFNAPIAFNNSSFIYLKNASTGFAQSHLYQHIQSSSSRMYIDSFSRKWIYLPDSNNIIIRQAIFPTSGGTEPSSYATVINGIIGPQSACVGHSLIFNVYDPVTLKPLYNQPTPSTVKTGTLGGFMGSAPFCNFGGRDWNFEFSLLDTAGRRSARDFLRWVPSGFLLTARLNYDNPTPFIDTWKADAAYWGTGNTLYDQLKTMGFTAVDSFYKPRTFVFILKPNTSSFTPAWKISNGIYDAVALDLNIASSDTLGYITSPVFGPASSWKRLQWKGASSETNTGDAINLYLMGVEANGTKTQLFSLGMNDVDVDISTINAAKYPNLQLMMRNSDSVYLTPYQLKYWRLLADFIPEGAIASNIKYSFKDSTEVGDQMSVAITFKNVSDIPFRDSIAVKMQIVDANNNTVIVPINKLKKLLPNDTAVVYTTIDTKKFIGTNTMFMEFNPDTLQPEQYHFNNYVYKNFYVKSDVFNPLLDVTFDGVHILNRDIVSSTPTIKIRLKDEAKYLLLNDTALVNVQLRYPDGSLRRFKFDSDTLKFTPASSTNAENVAILDFLPYLPDDGIYQLIVSAKDKTGNAAGNQEYRIQFMVLNKPAISNLFNYPNPFTSSTAFVFTLTGREVPQNIKIQILSITGKIVREITREELGDLHIGNNITSFKWDGTDMYGAKLGNGVYLYRVVTRLNGAEIDKYNPTNKNGGQSNTDSYFKGGYGKMYLMR